MSFRGLPTPPPASCLRVRVLRVLHDAPLQHVQEALQNAVPVVAEGAVFMLSGEPHLTSRAQDLRCLLAMLSIYIHVVVKDGSGRMDARVLQTLDVIQPRPPLLLRQDVGCLPQARECPVRAVEHPRKHHLARKEDGLQEGSLRVVAVRDELQLSRQRLALSVRERVAPTEPRVKFGFVHHPPGRPLRCPRAAPIRLTLAVDGLVQDAVKRIGFPSLHHVYTPQEKPTQAQAYRARLRVRLEP
eukprot:scaffold1954_cov268-Pinguiococcus_pyrenoidosus.AAC.143